MHTHEDGRQPIEDATIVGEEMTRRLREIDGFGGFLLLSRKGASSGLPFWDSREFAERHRVVQRQFLERMTSVADVQIEEIVDHQVTFAELGRLSVSTS